MKSFQLLLAAFAATPPITAAGTASSCSPTSYSFRLDFAGTCDAGAGLDGGGIENSLCFFTWGTDADDVDGEDVEFGAAAVPRERRRFGGHRSRGGEGRRWDHVLDGLDFSSELAHSERIAKETRNRRQPRRHRRAQRLDIAPTVVTSVTFLEADTTLQLNIINQNSTYFETRSADGDILVYPSVSSGLDPALPLEDQMSIVPGGVMLALFGVTASGGVVRNTVAWAHDARDGPAEGDGAGWIVLAGRARPGAAFCDSVAGGPAMTDVNKGEVAGGPANANRGSKSQGAFAKAAKNGKGEADVDTKAQKVGAEHGVKSNKAFGGGKSSKAKSSEDAKSAKSEGGPRGEEHPAAKGTHLSKSKKTASGNADAGEISGSSSPLSGKSELSKNGKATKVSKSESAKGLKSKSAKGEDYGAAEAAAKAAKAKSSEGKSAKAAKAKSYRGETESSRGTPAPRVGGDDAGGDARESHGTTPADGGRPSVELRLNRKRAHVGAGTFELPRRTG